MMQLLVVDVTVLILLMFGLRWRFLDVYRPTNVAVGVVFALVAVPKNLCKLLRRTRTRKSRPVAGVAEVEILAPFLLCLAFLHPLKIPPMIQWLEGRWLARQWLERRWLVFFDFWLNCSIFWQGRVRRHKSHPRSCWPRNRNDRSCAIVIRRRWNRAGLIQFLLFATIVCCLPSRIPPFFWWRCSGRTGEFECPCTVWAWWPRWTYGSWIFL